MTGSLQAEAASNTAWLFPGQGSQYPGMAADIYEYYSTFRRVVDDASEALSFDVGRLCFKDPEQQLNDTFYTQVTVFTVSVGIGRILEETGLSPGVVAGHSLGEYAALCIAGAFSFETGVNLVKKRAELMRASAEATQGGMTAVISAELSNVRQVVEEFGVNGDLVIANYNCPGQTVISGKLNLLTEAEKVLARAGAGKVIRLPVSGAFHSPLMREAAKELEEYLDALAIKRPKIPIVMNRTAQIEQDPVKIRRALAEQLTGPVKWQQSVETIFDMGVKSFIEVGPGRVIGGLLKKIDRNAVTRRTDSLSCLTRLQTEGA